MNNKKRAIKDIQQFCRDIKNSKKFNAIYNSQSSFSYYNPTIEPILLNESDESLNCYSGFYNKNNNLNVFINYFINFIKSNKLYKNQLLLMHTYIYLFLFKFINYDVLNLYIYVLYEYS